MAANQEIPIDDDDLDALMAELETETAGMVVTPVIAAAPVAVAGGDVDAEMAALDADLENQVMPKPVKKTPAPATTVTPLEPATSVADLDALEAELDAAIAAPPTPDKKEAIAKIIDKGVAATAATVATIPVKDDDVDADIAALEAELTAATGADDLKSLKVSGDIALTTKDAEMLIEQIDNPAPPNAALLKATERAREREAAKPADDAPFEPAPKQAAAPARPGAALQFHIDVDAFRSDTKVSDTNLDDCMMQQAGLLAHYAALLARSEAQAARVELQVEIAEAKLYDRHRKTLALGSEKVTEKMVENAVRMDPDYAKIKVREIEANSIAQINKGLVESLKQRRDMIIQLGADRREDGKGQARILAQQQAHDDLSKRATMAGQMQRGG